MSVLIKGMEMPTVRDTLVLVKTNGTAIVYEDETYVTTAVPVPPHGDLIDRDYLKQTHCAECTLYPDNCLEKSGEECDWSSIVHLNMCPIIIPADGKDIKVPTREDGE